MKNNAEQANQEILLFDDIEKRLQASKRRNIKWLLKNKAKEHGDKKLGAEFNWTMLSNFENIPEIDRANDETKIEGTVKFIQRQTKHKRSGILNNPCKALATIDYIRIKNILLAFFKTNLKFNFNSIIDDKLINAFKHYTEPKRKAQNKIIQKYKNSLPF